MTAGEARGQTTRELTSASDQPTQQSSRSGSQASPERAARERPLAEKAVESTAPGPDRQALEGPFTTRQLLRLDEALRVADTSTGLTFSVYLGDLEEPVRPHVERLHGQLADPPRSVLLAVCPNRRALEIVTGALARRRLPDRDCKLAALSMTAAFSGGDLAGGLVAGLAQLADHGRP